ncbi:unnamed protein product [Rodentolepis nana]|uniref:Uncharacterized protein n=1 Tax=Rodentolepis nana TaxID=102285 RepID=A0A0R3T8M2_RODNA|nr:unnamed protein product [Rodentolepis nana]
MNEGPREWNLSMFRCFRESDSTSHLIPSSSNSNSSESDSAAKGKSQVNGVWLTRRDHSAAPLVIRVSDFAHLVIMQGTEIVESYFLILAKKWIKMVNIEEEIMFYIRERSRVRRLRLTFGSVDDARSCYSHLSQYVSAKPPSNALGDVESSKLSEEEDSRVSHYLSLMTSIGPKSGDCSAQADAAWYTNWPTDRLVELVKLCLNDKNFPGFVRQVQECLQILAPLQNEEFVATQNQMEE